MGGLEALAFAVVEVEDEIVFGDEVAGVEAEEDGGLVDGGVRAFEFDVGADGGFVVVDEEIGSPFVFGGEFVGRAEFFVAEPAAETESFKDFLEHGGVVEDGFEFFAHFVAAVVRRDSGGADGELLGGRFKGEEMALRGGLLPFRFCTKTRANREIGVPGFRCGGGFGADAEKLAMLRKAAVGSVEEKVVFVDARRDGFGAEFCQRAEKGLGVGDAELDLDFSRHGGIVREEVGSR